MFLICSIHAMSTESTPSPAPAAPQSPALVADTANAVALDEFGYNLDDYDWVPVLRKRRVDGWTHTRQRKFIEVGANGGFAQPQLRLGLRLYRFTIKCAGFELRCRTAHYAVRYAPKYILCLCRRCVVGEQSAYANGRFALRF